MALIEEDLLILQRFLLVISVITILIVFAVIMSTWIVKLRPEWREVTNSLEDITRDLQTENWNSALASLGELTQSWGAIYNRIDFVEERLPLFSFETNFARLRGSIMAQDKSSGLQLVLEMKSLWDNF